VSSYVTILWQKKRRKKNNNLFSREFSHTAEKLPPATFLTINLSAQMKLIFKALVKEMRVEGEEE
jgi:hypothetical protein